MEVINVAGAVVAIYNVPGEGDVGAARVGLEVANNFLGICMCWQPRLKLQYSMTIQAHVS